MYVQEKSKPFKKSVFYILKGFFKWLKIISKKKSEHLLLERKNLFCIYTENHVWNKENIIFKKRFGYFRKLWFTLKTNWTSKKDQKAKKWKIKRSIWQYHKKWVKTKSFIYKFKLFISIACQEKFKLLNMRIRQARE